MSREPKPKVSITIEGLAPEQARELLRSLVGAEESDVADDAWLVDSAGEHPPPSGHTYRSLSDAARDGSLLARRGPRGLSFTDAALQEYEAIRAERRRRPKKARVQPEPDPFDPVNALAAANVVLMKPRKKEP